MTSLVISLLPGCDSNINGINNNQTQALQKPIQIIQVLDTETEKAILMSEFINELVFIPLEYHENCILKEITKIRVVDNSIFISDDMESGVYHFDIEGNFIRIIGKKGRGPGEHLRLTDFSIDSDHKRVYIYCNMNQQVFEYNFEGEFLNAINTSYAADAFEYHDGSFYLFRENPVLFEDFNLIIKSIKGKTLAKHFQSNPDFKTNARMVFSPTTDNLLLMNPNHDTIYRISGDQVKYAYYIDYGKSKITNPKHYKEIMKRSPEDRFGALKILLQERYVVGSYNFMEVGDLVYFTFIKDIYTKYALYNLVTEEVKTGISLRNDINQLSIGPPISCTDECLISIYQPENIYRDLDRLKKLPIDEASDSTKRNIDDVLSLLAKDVEKANPLIVFLKIDWNAKK